MTVEIYGRKGCSQCEQAKLAFHRAKVDYTYLMLDDHITELEGKFESLPRSLPYIVHADTMYTFADVQKLVAELKA